MSSSSDARRLDDAAATRLLPNPGRACNATAQQIDAVFREAGHRIQRGRQTRPIGAGEHFPAIFRSHRVLRDAELRRRYGEIGEKRHCRPGRFTAGWIPERWINGFRSPGGGAGCWELYRRNGQMPVNDRTGDFIKYLNHRK